MRFVLSVTVAICALMVPCGGVMAQTQATTTSGSPYYGAVPAYNTNAVPVPLTQMVAGQNAPSYNYNQASANTVQPYNFNAGPTGQYYQPQGTLTPEQEAMLEAQMIQQSMMQQPMAQNGNNYLQAQLSQLTQGPFANQSSDVPTKRTVKRVVRNGLNDPLKAPPRLFNPDQ